MAEYFKDAISFIRSLRKDSSELENVQRTWVKGLTPEMHYKVFGNYNNMSNPGSPQRTNTRPLCNHQNKKSKNLQRSTKLAKRNESTHSPSTNNFIFQIELNF